jgi:TolB protein
MGSRLRLPHIYVMPATGGAQQLVSPYVHGQLGYYTSPDWSPTSTEIAFHGHWNSRGTYQIMIADAARPGAQIRQLTSTGANEDPSWAPDGRHLVFTHAGVRGTSPGLYVVDTATGTRRPLTTGSEGYRLADWSPVLLKAADINVAKP